MIQLSKYCEGIKLKNRDSIIWFEGALEKAEETYFVLLIPESRVDDLKKGDIAEWE